jgi:hypothetical protein
MPYDVSMPYADPYDERAKEARRKHYRNNKETYLANARAREREMQEYVWSEKSKPCMDCGIQYVGWVMQFDHRPDEEKVNNIGPLIRNGSWSKLKEEIAKCDVVCANCHIVRTATRAGWQLGITV